MRPQGAFRHCTAPGVEITAAVIVALLLHWPSFAMNVAVGTRQSPAPTECRWCRQRLLSIQGHLYVLRLCGLRWALRIYPGSQTMIRHISAESAFMHLSHFS